jgi:hypothetical protein
MLRAQRTWKALVQPPGCWQAITAPSLRPQIAQRLSSLQGEHARAGKDKSGPKWSIGREHRGIRQHCI